MWKTDKPSLTIYSSGERQWDKHKHSFSDEIHAMKKNKAVKGTVPGGGDRVLLLFCSWAIGWLECRGSGTSWEPWASCDQCQQEWRTETKPNDLRQIGEEVASVGVQSVGSCHGSLEFWVLSPSHSWKMVSLSGVSRAPGLSPRPPPRVVGAKTGLETLLFNTGYLTLLLSQN